MTTTNRNRVAMENDGSRADGRAKVTGAAKYTYDINLPNMMHAAIVRAPFGNARMTSFDLDGARALRGAIDVDFDQANRSGQRRGIDLPAAYAGQPVGYVCAESPQLVRDAIAALKMVWEHGEVQTNFRRLAGAIPEPDAATAERLTALAGRAAASIKSDYWTQVQHHTSLETHGAVVDYKGDRAEVWSSTQAVSGMPRQFSQPLGLDASSVAVHADYVGGGFGSKFSAGIEGTVPAMLSRKHGRPCKLMNDRKAECMDTGVRPGSRQYFELHADESGKVLGGRILLWGAAGARGSGGGVSFCNYDLGEVSRPRGATGIALSGTDARPQRAPGWPQGSWGIEGALDELAAALGMDPIQIRKVNDPREHRKRMLDVVAREIGWERRRPDGQWPGTVKRGFGIGAHQWGNGNFSNCAIEARVMRDGKMEVRSGTQDIGTGTRTILADLAAYQTGLDRKFIVGLTGRTEYPAGPASGGSVVTRSIAPPTLNAAKQAGDAIIALAAAELNVEAATFQIKGDQIVDRASGEAKMAWLDACKLMIGDHVTKTADSEQSRAFRGNGDSDGICMAEVEVDIETGVVKVIKLVNAQQVGKAINRKLVESQIVGAAIQGISFALFEDRILNEVNGAGVNPNMEWYKIAGPCDMPEIVPIIDSPDDYTGARAAGEPPIVGVPGAIGNAVANAIGKRVYSMPITPAKVLAALA